MLLPGYNDTQTSWTYFDELALLVADNTDTRAMWHFVSPSTKIECQEQLKHWQKDMPELSRQCLCDDVRGRHYRSCPFVGANAVFDTQFLVLRPPLDTPYSTAGAR